MEQKVIALPPPKVSETMEMITKNKPINASGLVNPKMIQLQALNVVEISLGKVFALPYVVVYVDDESCLGLLNPITRTLLRHFPVGTTTQGLNAAIRHGRITCWYSTIGDFINKRNRVPLEFGGVTNVS